jgi:hypothetical protein
MVRLTAVVLSCLALSAAEWGPLQRLLLVLPISNLQMGLQGQGLPPSRGLVKRILLGWGRPLSRPGLAGLEVRYCRESIPPLLPSPSQQSPLHLPHLPTCSPTPLLQPGAPAPAG